MVICLIAAAIGGWTAHRVAGSLGAVTGLLLVVLAFGLADAGYHQWLAPGTAMAYAQLDWLHRLVGFREPLWYDLALPALMALFVWVAGSGRDLENAPCKQLPPGAVQ